LLSIRFKSEEFEANRMMSVIGMFQQLQFAPILPVNAGSRIPRSR
jgi:hypothetical protein